MVTSKVNATNLESGVGPQCLACKRRQVKCDSTPIACEKCQKDGIVCPGYKKPLKWNHFEAPRRPGAKLHRIQSDSFNDRTIEVVRRNPEQNKETALILGAVEYYNKHMAPYAPAHLPFKRQFVPIELWPFVPVGLQYTLFVIAKTRQCHEAMCDPILNRDLVQYRGRSLRALQKLLSDVDQVTNDPYALALQSVLFVMGIEIQLCEEHWTGHLEAARRIILWRGGLQKCLDAPLVASGPLVEWFYTDIISATACNAWSLNSMAVQSQFEYLSMIPNMQAQLVAACHPWPQQILLAIAYTNILRARLLRPLTSEERHVLGMHTFTFETVQETIIEFDSYIWAIGMSNQDRTLPEKAGDELEDLSVTSLASLAECFKSAALLYLYLSCNSDPLNSELVVSAKGNLSFHLQHLFEKADVDTDGPLYSRLWTFTIWPVFVSAYAAAGWNLGIDGLESDFDRMKAIKMGSPAGQVLNIEKRIREVQERHSSGSDVRPLNWDDGFTTRCAFVV